MQYEYEATTRNKQRETLTETDAERRTVVRKNDTCLRIPEVIVQELRQAYSFGIIF